MDGKEYMVRPGVGELPGWASATPPLAVVLARRPLAARLKRLRVEGLEIGMKGRE
jgi:hypothetical protein